MLHTREETRLSPEEQLKIIKRGVAEIITEEDLLRKLRRSQETGKPLEWIGPVLEEEGLRVFYYWPQDSFRRSLLEKLHELGAETPQNMRTELSPSTKDK